MNKEIWVDIEGCKGRYQISNLGRVKSLNWRKQHKEGILKGINDHKGYLKVNLRIDGKIHPMYIHRLVATHFISNPNNYPIVNHKDENTFNNSADNLEWCTDKYNLNYGTCREKMRKARLGIKLSEETKQKLSESQRGSKHWNYGKHLSEETKQKIRGPRPQCSGKNHHGSIKCTCDNLNFDSIAEVAKYLNKCHGTVYYWLYGKSKMPKEYIDRKLQFLEGENN